MSVLDPLTSDQVYTNGRVKINPRTGEPMECLVSSRPIFKAVAADLRKHPSKPHKEPLAGRDIWEAEEASEAFLARLEEREAHERRRAASRAKRHVFDLALCNDFDLFVTLTLNREEIDRYDYKSAVRKLMQ